MNSEISTTPKTNDEDIEKSKKRKTDQFEQKSKKICTKDIRRGINKPSTEETDYYFDNYLRKVYPYYFTYTTHCKGRWVGKRLIDVFSDEFRAHSKEEYEKNIRSGNIKINDKSISADYVFKENDKVTNRAHRHETPVAAAPIRIIHSSNEFVVIDKPPSVPVHPCGRYRHNCLLFILAKEHNLGELYSVHRLDRLTSGILVFAKTIRRSQEINEQIRERKVNKEYVCRVEGKFPDGEITCKEPIEVISPKMGICIASSNGKESETVFERMSYNGKTSVVRCKPLTGRMHQIRVHLQYLGHPIINDPIYNHESVFGPDKGKGGCIGKTKEKLLEDLLKTHNLQKWLLDDNLPLEVKSENGANGSENLVDGTENKIALSALDHYLKAEGYEQLRDEYKMKLEKFTKEETCDLCHQKYMDPEPKDLILFLHALKYSGDGWGFSTELPAWAQEDWDDSKIIS
ncbi:pseudouridylate synthase RPUSD2 [Parasteatoda tepidariorum]|uniref:pseudouridylate synthase RPUSD2 n=1 Tax=Parasteatoda tepidariorum TaxID=114398 RepID=UPI001C729562|nr:RNA pseudouridylate synthase domain-containing protein 2 [Parasteatoda tepidariorum]